MNWRPAELGYFDPLDVRQAAYRAVFAGACGHTYGCHPVWQFLDAGRTPIGFARRNWREALDLPAAGQMGHLRRLIESRPMLSRVPDSAWVIDPAAHPDARHACRGDGYGFVYLPRGGPVTVRLGEWMTDRVRAWWYDPTGGGALDLGVQERRDQLTFNPPWPGTDIDAVLVLDDAARGFPAPGGPPFAFPHAAESAAEPTSRRGA